MLYDPGRVGGQSGCERRIEVFVKIQKKNFFLGGGRGGGGRWGGGSGSGWGVRVDVNEEWNFCENSKKNVFFLGGGGSVVVGGGGVGGGVRVDLNEELKFS